MLVKDDSSISCALTPFPNTPIYTQCETGRASRAKLLGNKQLKTLGFLVPACDITRCQTVAVLGEDAGVVMMNELLQAVEAAVLGCLVSWGFEVIGVYGVLVTPLSYWMLADGFVAARTAFDQLSSELSVVEMSRDEQRDAKLILKH